VPEPVEALVMVMPVPTDAEIPVVFDWVVE